MTQTSLWMTELWYSSQINESPRGPFYKRPLHEITLPGTHDSGCYIDHAANFLSKTQRHNIRRQLEDGIRYFDIRPYFDENEIYTYHKQFYTGDRINGGDGILRQIRNFLVEAGNKAEEAETLDCELIILNISHFYKFNLSQHDALINLISETFGDFLVPHKQKDLNLFGAPYEILLTDKSGTTKSRVAVLYDGALDTDPDEVIRLKSFENDFPKGFFVLSPKYRGVLNGFDSTFNRIYLFDQYSKSIGVDDGRIYEGMRTDQLKKLLFRERYPYSEESWAKFNGLQKFWKANKAGGRKATLHVLSWTLTPQKILREPLIYARYYANPALLPFFEDPKLWTGPYYDPLADPQINVIYVDDYDSLSHDRPHSPWNGLPMPVAIAAQLNVGSIHPDW